MSQDFWTAIELKLESAERRLQHASQSIRPPGAIVSNPRWRAELFAHISAFLADCRSVPDLIQSYFGIEGKFGKKHKKWLADKNYTKWLSQLPPGEEIRRGQFQLSFRPGRSMGLYERFSKLPLSRARVDTVHRQGFPEVWGKVGKRYSPLQHLTDTINERIIAGSDTALQWAATLPPQQVLYLPSDFFFKTAGGRYKPLFPECQSYLRRTRELVGKVRKLCDKVHKGQALTKPPRKT